LKKEHQSAAEERKKLSLPDGEKKSFKLRDRARSTDLSDEGIIRGMITREYNKPASLKGMVERGRSQSIRMIKGGLQE